MPPARKLRVGAGILVSLLVVAWLGIAVQTEHSLIHPQRSSVGAGPASLGLPFADVSFRSGDGISLQGWWVPGTLHRTVVLLHGYKGNRSEAWDIAGPFLHRAGYNVLAFDFRGSGLSGGDRVTVGHLEPRDAVAAVARARSLDPGPVAILGFSLGAGVALEVGPQLPEVRAIVEDSGWTTLDDVLRVSFDKFAHVPAWLFQPPVVAAGQLDAGFRVTDVRPVDSAPRLKQPLLAIIGDDDTLIPPAQGREIYLRAPPPKQILEIPGAAHTKAHAKDPQLYEQTVLDFLDHYLLKG